MSSHPTSAHCRGLNGIDGAECGCVPTQRGHGSFAPEELEDAGEVVAAMHAVLELRVARRHRVRHATLRLR